MTTGTGIAIGAAGGVAAGVATTWLSGILIRKYGKATTLDKQVKGVVNNYEKRFGNPPPSIFQMKGVYSEGAVEEAKTLLREELGRTLADLQAQCKELYQTNKGMQETLKALNGPRS